MVAGEFSIPGSVRGLRTHVNLCSYFGFTRAAPPLMECLLKACTPGTSTIKDKAIRQPVVAGRRVGLAPNFSSSLSS